MRKTVVTSIGIVTRLFQAKSVRKRKTSPNGVFIFNLLSNTILFLFCPLHPILGAGRRYLALDPVVTDRV